MVWRNGWWATVHDAGNSGGPVFNQTTAQVVGVAFAGISGAEGKWDRAPVPRTHALQPRTLMRMPDNWLQV